MFTNQCIKAIKTLIAPFVASLKQQTLDSLENGLGGGRLYAAQGHAHGVGLHVHFDLDQAVDANLLSVFAQHAGAQSGGAVHNELSRVR